MDSRIAIVIVLLLTGGGVFGQEIVESIPWEASRKLTWDDFKGPVPPDAVPAATTASGISYRYSANLMHHEVNLDFDVTAYFYPEESWYKAERCDAQILQHEQLHFDISEVFARRMRMKLRQTSFTENVKSEIQKIYRETLNELEDLQDQYDWETNFSRNTEAQERWNTRIKEALERLPHE